MGNMHCVVSLQLTLVAFCALNCASVGIASKDIFAFIVLYGITWCESVGGEYPENLYT
jgi:uncharacterized membrane protein YuzA (DUF378 family)